MPTYSFIDLRRYAPGPIKIFLFKDYIIISFYENSITPIELHVIALCLNISELFHLLIRIAFMIVYISHVVEPIKGAEMYP